MASDLNSAQERDRPQRRCRGRGVRLTGPILLVTLGVLFLVGEFVPYWGVGRTWPLILIVVGLSKLLESVGPGRPTHSS